MTSMTYATAGYMEPVDGRMCFTKEGFLPVELELDLETDGENWTIEHVTVVEHHVIRKYATSRKLTGELRENVIEMASLHWSDKITSFVQAEYEPEEDESAVERWKEAG